jgi:hypothetical protein
VIDAGLHIWMNAGLILVAAGAAAYFSLWRYMD